jgi:hypothetical protein
LLQKIVGRIAGVPPACGCTQPPTSEVYIATAFGVALRQIAAETAAFIKFFVIKKIVPLVPPVPQKSQT